MSRDKDLQKKVDKIATTTDNRMHDIDQDIRMLDAIARAFGKKPDKQEPH